ncbi:MAG: hypothetical protein IPK03_13230 [Bacteroidetes bacterium]|nr:hypothetical protein [Bacteroidota bacterium]
MNKNSNSFEEILVTILYVLTGAYVINHILGNSDVKDVEIENEKMRRESIKRTNKTPPTKEPQTKKKKTKKKTPKKKKKKTRPRKSPGKTPTKKEIKSLKEHGHLIIVSLIVLVWGFISLFFILKNSNQLVLVL